MAGSEANGLPAGVEAGGSGGGTGSDAGLVGAGGTGSTNSPCTTSNQRVLTPPSPPKRSHREQQGTITLEVCRSLAPNV